MTIDLLGPNDTGDIPRHPGETRIRIDTGEATQRIDPRLIKAPSFDAIPRKVIEIDETVVFHIPQTIGVVPDFAAAQPIAPWERVIGAELTTPSGPKPAPQLPKPPRPAAPGKYASHPHSFPADETVPVSLLGSVAGLDGELRPKGYVGRHRDPRGLIADAGALPAWSDLGRIDEPVEAGAEAEVASLPLLARVAILFGGTLFAGASIGLGIILVVVR